MEDFLNFKKMITPIIIRVIFWVLVVLFVLGGLVQIVGGTVGGASGGGKAVIIGFVMALGGPLAARIYCEILIVVFSINDTLIEIRDNTRGMRGPATEPVAPPSMQR